MSGPPCFRPLPHGKGRDGGKVLLSSARHAAGRGKVPVREPGSRGHPGAVLARGATGLRPSRVGGAGGRGRFLGARAGRNAGGWPGLPGHPPAGAGIGSPAGLLACAPRSAGSLGSGKGQVPLPTFRQGGDLGGGRGDPPQGGGHGRQPRADAVAVRLGPGPNLALVAQTPAYR